MKSSYCHWCALNKSKRDSAKYVEEVETHEKVCHASHEGPSGKMEVDAVIEMFLRSIKTLRVRFMNYIGDGDSKIFSGILKAAPYRNDLVTKKECVGHVQKMMGTRLRALKETNKGLGGKVNLLVK